MIRRIVISFVICCFSLGVPAAQAFPSSDDTDYNRARLLGYVLLQYLKANNFSQKKLDDALSRDAFGLYLKQLDGQKRFLLRDDVEKLRTYADRIDDELITGKIELPEVSVAIVDRRTAAVREMIKELLAKDFDFSADETVETDADKLEYCATEAELKERWRKMLKYQVLNQYLTLLDDAKDAKAETGDKKNEGAGSGKEEKSPADLRKKAREKVLKSYEDSFARMRQEKKSERYDRYLGAVTRAYDPHTSYMPPTSKEDFDISMKGTLEGIGAVLREEDGNIKVESVKLGGPAARQGQLLAGDLILKVAEAGGDPVDVTEMRLRDAVRLIRGKKGTEVKLTVKRQGMPSFVIAIVRDVIQLDDTFAKGTTLTDEKSGKSFGYIKLPSFYRDFEQHGSGERARTSTDDMKAELKKLASGSISGLVLDLRNNGGGALTDAVDIAGLFIREGPVVQVKNGLGKVTVLSDEDPEVYYRGPVVVLVNQFSASASEILAGALQDYGRAVVIGGEHTHGKGTVQMVLDLNESMSFGGMEQYKPLGALMITIQKFYRVSGESTQYRGVVPDIILPDALKGLKTGEQYLDFALPWDTVNPVPYAKWQSPAPEVNALKLKSSERIKDDKDFAAIISDGSRLEEHRKKTLQSLRLDTVRKERESAQAALKLKGLDGILSVPGSAHGASGVGGAGKRGLFCFRPCRRPACSLQVRMPVFSAVFEGRPAQNR